MTSRAQYESAIQARDKTIETLREILAAYQQQLKDLTNASESASSVAELEVQIKALENDKTKLMDINNSQKQEILTYKTKIEQSNEQLNDADAFYTTANEEIATLRKKTQKLKDTKKKLEKKLEKNEINTAKMMKDYDIRLNEKRSDIIALRGEINKKALEVSKEKSNVKDIQLQLVSSERMLMYNEDILSQKYEIECLKKEFLDIQTKEEDEKSIRIRDLEDMLHHEQKAREKLQNERELLLDKLKQTSRNNNINNGSPKRRNHNNNNNNNNNDDDTMIMNNNNTMNNNNDVNTMMNIPKDLSFVDSPNGMYDPLLPSNEYGVNSKSNSPIRTPNRRGSHSRGKDDDYDDNESDEDESSCCC